MSNESTKQSFIDILEGNVHFQALPEGLQKKYINAGVDNAVDLCKDLCLQANRFLSRNHKNGAIKALILAEELASLVNDTEKCSQINAWLALLDEEDVEITKEVISMIQDEIRQTHEFKRFQREVLNQDV